LKNHDSAKKKHVFFVKKEKKSMINKCGVFFLKTHILKKSKSFYFFKIFNLFTLSFCFSNNLIVNKIKSCYRQEKRCKK